MSWEKVDATPAPVAADPWATAAGPSNHANGEAGPAGDAFGSGGDEATDSAVELDSGPELSKEELIQRVKARGWTDRSAFDYEQFQRVGGDDGDYHGDAKKYEWKEEYGDVGPAVPELETMLFGGEFQMRKGKHLEALELNVTVDGEKNLSRIAKFEDAGLHPVVLHNIELAAYGKPTPIQSYTIPAVLDGRDVLAIAQTGSGKTAAYLIPIISKLMGKAKKLAAPRPDTTAAGYNPRLHKVRAEPLVVIVVPTRELAMQIFDEARRMCYRSMLRPCVVYGGLPMGPTFDQLGAGCDVLIATPGRLCDLMDRPHVLTMARVKYTVIDEADEMLDTDWSDELQKILAGGDTNEDADHVYIMTSATFPKSIRKLANEYLAADYARVRVGQTASAHKNITQEIVWVEGNKKPEACEDLLLNMECPGRTMIFCNSKAAVDRLDDYLYNRGLPTTSIHADRNQREREDAMRAFRTGKAPILIATGISARGWDVKDCHNVINYDLPSATYGGITEYIHRIGRTGRIGHKGMATSFYNERDEDLAPELVKVLVHCGQTVPEFLESHKPEEGQEVNFDDDSDDEDEAGGEGFGRGDGGFGGNESGFGDSGDDGDGNVAWGAPAEATDSGFTPAARSQANDGATGGTAW